MNKPIILINSLYNTILHNKYLLILTFQEISPTIKILTVIASTIVIQEDCGYRPVRIRPAVPWYPWRCWLPGRGVCGRSAWTEAVPARSSHCPHPPPEQVKQTHIYLNTNTSLDWIINTKPILNFEFVKE